MRRRELDSDPELRAFLNPCRIERHLPPETRARVLARVREIAAYGGAAPPAPVREDHASVRARRTPRSVRIAAATLVALAGGAVWAVLALHARLDRTPVPTGPQQTPSPTLEPPAAQDASRSRLAAPAVAWEQTETVGTTRRHRRASDADVITADGLRLLGRAHAAYSRNELPSALALIGEHARRFPRGPLAEEREALRVRSLFGAGRTEEAHIAAAAFAARFPRSVLLPRAHDGEKAPGEGAGND